MDIIKASLQDLKQVKDISQSQFGHFGWAEDFFASEIFSGEHEFYVLSDEKNVYAFVIFMLTEGESGKDINILNIATAPNHTRKGYATYMMNFVKNYAEQKNIHKIWLEVRESNLSAIKFYENYGFKELYVRKNYYSGGENAIVYEYAF